MYKIAAELGLSGPGLKKICQRHKIPTPGRGYWQKLRHGKKVHRPPLPEFPSDQAKRSIRLGKPSPPSSSPNRQMACFGPVAEQRHFEDQEENQIVVKDHLRGSHPLIREVREGWKAGRSRNSRTRRGRRTPILNIKVSQDSQRRALLIMNALLKSLERRGYPVRISDSSKNPTVADIFGQEVEFHLQERRKQVEREPEPGSLRASWDRDRTYDDLDWTGRLTLQIDEYVDVPQKSWTDGKVQRLENCLNDFVVALVAAGKKLQERSQRHRLRDIQRQREREERQKRERREQLERERIEELKRQVKAWEWSKRIRNYLTAQGTSATEQGRIAKGGPGLSPEEWRRWPTRYSDRIDPLRSSNSERDRKEAPNGEL